jgi:hypothetical protein
MRQTRAEWARRVEEWKRSGLSGPQFGAVAHHQLDDDHDISVDLDRHSYPFGEYRS